MLGSQLFFAVEDMLVASIGAWVAECEDACSLGVTSQ